MSNIKAPSAGGVEIDSALSDLKAAFKIDPSNPSVKRELSRLKQSLKKQRLTDKSNYSGLFERGGNLSRRDAGEANTKKAR